MQHFFYSRTPTVVRYAIVFNSGILGTKSTSVKEDILSKMDSNVRNIKMSKGFYLRVEDARRKFC